MGLDMTINSTKPSNIEKRNSDVDFQVISFEKTDEISSWSKCMGLHQWMEDLFKRKGGKGSFLYEDLILNKEDLVSLDEELGDGERSDFITEALDNLESGNVVFYSSL